MIFFVILIIVSLFLFGFGGAAFAFGLIAIAAFVMAGIKLRKGWQVVTEQDRKAGPGCAVGREVDSGPQPARDERLAWRNADRFRLDRETRGRAQI
jgi:hypothetical protein